MGCALVARPCTMVALVFGCALAGAALSKAVLGSTRAGKARPSKRAAWRFAMPDSVHLVYALRSMSVNSLSCLCRREHSFGECWWLHIPARK